MKKYKKQVLTLTGMGVTSAVGARAVGGIGGAAATHAATGLSEFSSFMPAMGTVMGGGMTVGMTKKLIPGGKRRRRY